MAKMDLSEAAVVSTPEHPVLTGRATELAPSGAGFLQPNLAGVKRWAEEYNSQFVSEERLSGSISSFMAEHDAGVAREKEREEELGQPDEEGWVTVARQEKKKPEKKVESVEEEKKGRGKKNRRKKKKVELKNFYSHQIKEDKMTNIRALREKFEEDKQKIAKMKQERKFRPF